MLKLSLGLAVNGHETILLCLLHTVAAGKKCGELFMDPTVTVYFKNMLGMVFREDEDTKSYH
jgi:hypothetical protein